MTGNKLIIDNWTLQEIGQCLSEGLSSDSSSELSIDHTNDSHSFRELPAAGIQIDALLEFLIDIVLRDSIIVDSAFMDAWLDYEHTISTLLTKGIMRRLPLYEHEEQLFKPKQYALQQLCATSSLLETQRLNEESWETTGKADNQYMSQIIWGTAGMLSRSHVFEAPYSGHPLRKKVIEQTIFANSVRDTFTETLNWINEERLRLFEVHRIDGTQRTASIVLPPIAVEIIEESNNIGELIMVAYQFREKYAPLREWMKSVQEAMESEDSKRIAKYKKTLNAVSNDLNRAMGRTKTGSVSLKIGLDWPSISIPVPLDGVMKNFGMRAVLNNQIFTSQGEKSLRKLLRMFEEDSTRIGISVQEYLRLKVP